MEVWRALNGRGYFKIRFISCRTIKLKSDGLESDEYIEFVKGKGICYEDGCVIGTNADTGFEVYRRTYICQ